MSKINATLIVGDDEARPEWVLEMHSHVLQTGCYRPEDVRRVLGNPQECVEVKVFNELQLASRALSPKG